MFWYVPSNSSTPRRKESKDFSRKDIDIETQQLEIGKVPQNVGEVIYFSNLTTGTKALADASMC